ncbi:MAG: DUF3604 domain-containing protein [Halioglobus sp.]
MKKQLIAIGSMAAATLLPASVTWAQTETKLLWGDTHLHTSFSVDAYMAGNRSLGPDAAYRYAKGEPVVHPYNNTRVQIQQPLDFLAVSDHAEYLGVIPVILGGDYDQSEAGIFQEIKSWMMITALNYAIEDPLEGTKRFTGLLPEPEIQSGDSRDPIAAAVEAGTDGGLAGLGLIDDDAALRISASQWTKSMQIADRHNAPGEFTALVGWEWTQTASGANLHRIVVSDIDGSTATGIDPVGSGEAPYPEDLWNELEALSNKTNADFISIPHNSNLSKGYMFAKTTLKGEAIGSNYARTRMKWEPLVEATQIKGDSETHPDLAPGDEFAEFERFNFYLQAFPQALGYKAQQGDTVRSALKSGLELEKNIGVNPFKFGLIGSTDAHTSIASAEESNFWGKVATDSTPSTKRRDDPSGYSDGKQSFNGWNMSAGGLAAVWSEDNSREAIIAAMRRRETYATTGPRIQVRMFAGWEFSQADAESAEFVSIGYSGGVPMGGELSASPSNSAPSFLLRASRGPMDHNLDRIQIIKGWTDASGMAQEKIFNVAWSGDRQLDGAGKLAPVGSTANTQTGITANTIGSTELATVWMDPEFDPNQSAFYYARVIQIPTVRHSQLDAIALGVDTPYEGPATIQERAYTSPIWYTP